MCVRAGTAAHEALRPSTARHLPILVTDPLPASLPHVTVPTTLPTALTVSLSAPHHCHTPLHYHTHTTHHPRRTTRACAAQVTAVSQRDSTE